MLPDWPRPAKSRNSWSISGKATSAAISAACSSLSPIGTRTRNMTTFFQSNETSPGVAKGTWNGASLTSSPRLPMTWPALSYTTSAVIDVLAITVSIILYISWYSASFRPWRMCFAINAVSRGRVLAADTFRTALSMLVLKVRARCSREIIKLLVRTSCVVLAMRTKPASPALRAMLRRIAPLMREIFLSSRCA